MEEYKSFSQNHGAPGLAAMLNMRSELKRRVRMIAESKPAGTANRAACLLLFIGICGVAIPRASDAAPQNRSTPETARRESDPSYRNGVSSHVRITRILERMLADQEAKIEQATKALDSIRNESGITTHDLENPTHAFELIRMIEQDRINAMALTVRNETLRKQLGSLSKEELRSSSQSVSEFDSDARLAELQSRLWKAQFEHSLALTEYGANHPRVVRIQELEKKLEDQIDIRIQGILQAMEIQAEVQKANIEAASKNIENLKRQEAAKTEKYRPYFQAKRELENQMRILETLKLRLLEEKIDSALTDISPQWIAIDVKASGEQPWYSLEGRQLELGVLKEILKERHEENPGMVLRIRPDSNVPIQRLFGLFEVVRSIGMPVSLSTVKE